MPRPRIYADRADKQAAYRQRADISEELRELQHWLRLFALEGRDVTLNTSLIDTAGSPRDVLRAVVAQIKDARL